jgi:hypothetical protein
VGVHEVLAFRDANRVFERLALSTSGRRTAETAKAGALAGIGFLKPIPNQREGIYATFLPNGEWRTYWM